MITVEQAQNIINSQKKTWGVESVDLVHTVGRVLAEDIKADRDFPPFDRVTMDGIAINYDAYKEGERVFEVAFTQLAGEPKKRLADPTQAIEIMTGAILSDGCDVIIRYEDLDFFEEEGKKWVKILNEDISRWKNVHRQASDNSVGDLLVSEGIVINAALVAIFATVGCSTVKVRKLPRVAVISTGDELVDVDTVPEPHQIRKSNTISIQSELMSRQVECQLFHLQDDKEELRKRLSEILNEFDVILLTGGVSKGKADFIPEVLAELSVEKLFHRVAQRPGKPFWFGTTETGKPVFAFPGNPISTMMCFNVYFLKWLDKQMDIHRVPEKAVLAEDFYFRPELGYFLQVSSSINKMGQIEVVPEMGNGSGDLSNLAKSDAFLYLPAEKEEFLAGSSYKYYPFE